MSGVRHDLFHELATLRTLLDVVDGNTFLDDIAVRELVATARTEVGLALDLVEALPTHTPGSPARSESSLPHRRTTMAAPRTEVGGVLRAAAAAGAPRGRDISVDADADLHVALSRAALGRVVRNLLGNALAATVEGGTVRLLACSDPAGAHVRMEFHDDGPGPGPGGFHRGGGLGLEVVRSLVLPAGGWLVLGTSPFGGACAAVTLPAAVGAWE